MKELLEQALDALERNTIRAELAKPAANEWRDAIDEGLVCAHIGTVDSFPDPRAALNALIDWHVAVALDPEVSSDARALIDRGRAVAEPLSAEQILGAVARGWCHPRNKFKVMDPDIAIAIADEVSALIDAHGIKRSAA
jgi:hypothetical protein